MGVPYAKKENWLGRAFGSRSVLLSARLVRLALMS